MNPPCAQNAVIDAYFSSLNERDFESVAQLFSEEGSLCPPFEKKISGRVAIAKYLQSEATDLKAFPKTCTVESVSEGMTQYQVVGHVKTSFFTVNVGWSIQLNTASEIVSLQVKLLAELQDLLALKRP